MKFLLLICVDPGIPVPVEHASAHAWVDEMDGRGVRLEGHELASVTSATTVRIRGDRLARTDGPFAESKEFMAGFDIIECAELEEAVAVAAKHPVAHFGAVEVRAFA